MADFIEESKRSWIPQKGKRINREQLTIGCLQRIANATELMCKDRENLERENRNLRERRDFSIRQAERLQRQLSATRGVVTKLKNKLANITK